MNKRGIETWCRPDISQVCITKDYSVFDYGCNGKGNFTVYEVMEGVRIVFFDFDTADTIICDSEEKEGVEISYCMKGRFECTFKNQIVNYIGEGEFVINSAECMPTMFSFPLQVYEGVSIVINNKEFTKNIKLVLEEFGINTEDIYKELQLESRWYTTEASSKIKHVFWEFYEAKERENLDYFKIKVIELLYLIRDMTKKEDYKFTYYSGFQIEQVKQIKNHMTNYLDQRFSLEDLVKEHNISITLFNRIFRQVYGDTPYAYMKKLKMNQAAKELRDTKRKINEIALALGYSNASKFSKAFKDVIGVNPRTYRQQNNVLEHSD